jgi:hypothetical protein
MYADYVQNPASYRGLGDYVSVPYSGLGRLPSGTQAPPPGTFRPSFARKLNAPRRRTWSGYGAENNGGLFANATPFLFGAFVGFIFAQSQAASDWFRLRD